MELLHERLRELKGATANEIREREGVIHSDELIDKWVDEIERYYIPRPRFEDGEPVHRGDWFINANGYTIMVDTISFGDDCFTLNNDKRLNLITPVKRPTPKVLDADGVEIKRGDKVWRIHSKLAAESGSLIVEGICDKGVYTDLRVDGKAIFFDPSQLTHEKPVFDAEGVRIRKGDTVWDLDSGEKLHVVEFANRECGLVQCSNEDGDYEDHDAHRLTHREPDSLEKIRDDLELFLADFDFCEADDANDFVLRLTTLIERGA